MDTVKCRDCRFVLADDASRHWTIYRCSNTKSEYGGAMLYIGRDGKRRARASWSGCPEGETAIPERAMRGGREPCQEERKTN